MTNANCMGLEDGHAVKGNRWDKTVDAPDMDSEEGEVEVLGDGNVHDSHLVTQGREV